MQECIFCRIVRGELPSEVVYQTERVFAFLDIAPIAFGHVLVIPKEHYATLWEVPDALASELNQAWKQVGKAVMAATQATGLNVVMNNYASAGQVVHHAHWHLIPRREGDQLYQVVQGEYESKNSMQKMAADIRQALAG